MKTYKLSSGPVNTKYKYRCLLHGYNHCALFPSANARLYGLANYNHSFPKMINDILDSHCKFLIDEIGCDENITIVSKYTNKKHKMAVYEKKENKDIFDSYLDKVLLMDKFGKKYNIKIMTLKKYGYYGFVSVHQVKLFKNTFYVYMNTKESVDNAL